MLDILENEFKKYKIKEDLPFSGYFIYECKCFNCDKEEWIIEEN